MEILAVGLAEKGAAAPSESKGSSSYGRLPNLSYASNGIRWHPTASNGTKGVLSLQQHSRYLSLDAAGITGAAVQRTTLWHAERLVCVTASSGVGFLGMKSATALKELAGAGLKIYLKQEKNELGFKSCCSARLSDSKKPSEGQAADRLGPCSTGNGRCKGV